jgi:hypothetical protein
MDKVPKSTNSGLKTMVLKTVLVRDVVLALMAEALCYKPEGRGFDSLCGHLIFFSIDLILPATL